MKTKILTKLAFLAFLGGIFSNTADAYKPDPWARQIIAACLILEASNQGEEGMIAVANVINNRAYGEPSRIYRVVKKPYAFTSLNSATTGKTGKLGYAGHVTHASRDRNWKLALNIVDRLYAGTLPDLTGGATHYSLVGEHVSWMNSMRQTKVIGSHKFLRQG